MMPSAPEQGASFESVPLEANDAAKVVDLTSEPWGGAPDGDDAYRERGSPYPSFGEPRHRGETFPLREEPFLVWVIQGVGVGRPRQNPPA